MGVEWGSPRRARSIDRLPLHIRIKIVRTPGCWIWVAATGAGGYGLLTLAQQPWRAHRYVFEQLVGPIPEELELDHLCKVKRCVRPDHLEPVTHAENVRRAHDTPTCKHGHRWADGNEYRSPSHGRRSCRACNRDKRRARA